MLKPRQVRLAELMVAEPQLTKEEYAARVGCNTSTIYVWRKLPEFQEYYHDLCEKTFRSYEALAVKKLMENANKGNQKAIEYLLNYVGYKQPEQQQIQLDTNIIKVSVADD